jgi:hypothetical protein
MDQEKEGAVDESGKQEPSSHVNNSRVQQAKTLPGLKLRRTDEDWRASNAFFHSHFSDLLRSDRPIDCETDVANFQKSIYDYFSKQFGTLGNKETNGEFYEKYKALPIKSLKKSLHVLKNNALYTDTEEIKFLSKFIREKITHKSSLPTPPTDKDFNVNFWKTCNDWFNRALNISPKFSLADCFTYFQATLYCKQDNIFNIPSWFINIPPPSHPANVTPPSYSEVTRAINRARGTSSPCPYDSLSIIIFKRIPILRSVLTRLIAECWRTKYVPSVWRRGLTVLIFKKGDNSCPSNFRPITLQPALYKIFSSIYRDRIQSFLNSNGYLNTNIQKGFIGGVEGVLEHTELLDYVIRSAKRRQLSLFISLFDLKNAFGEIRHNLIRTSFKYHHMPDEFVDLFNNIYADFNISIACNNSTTAPIQVQRGVLQGDPSSPLLFNICFNSLVKIMDSPNYKKLGFIWGNKGTQTANWLQYADDAALISKDQKGAQGLANLFESWCSWAKMDIRLDKCSSFAMMKKDSTYCQILPKLSINSGNIPPTPLGESFKYLGRSFDFDMKGELEKAEITEKLDKLMKSTSELNVRPQTKLKIFNRFISSQISFSLRVCNFTATWVSETLDAICLRNIRLWIEAPISSCVAEWLISPKTNVA